MEVILKIYKIGAFTEDPVFVMSVIVPKVRYIEFKEDLKALALKYDRNAVIDVSKEVKP